MNKNTIKKGIAVLLIAAVSVPVGRYIGIGKLAEDLLGRSSSYQVQVGEHIHEGSPWIASFIAGVVDDSVTAREQDDFYTAANRTEILKIMETSSDINKEDFSEGPLAEAGKMITDLEIELAAHATAAAKDASYMNKIGIPDQILKHYYEIVGTVYDMSSDWETRDQLGIEPLKPYLDQIDQIADLDDMNRYLLNNDHSNPFLLNVLQCEIGTTKDFREQYNGILQVPGNFEFFMLNNYQTVDGDRAAKQAKIEEYIFYMTDRLGLNRKEAKKRLADCFILEEKLGLITGRKADSLSSSRLFSKAEVTELAGAYPLEELLQAQGFEKTENFIIRNPGYFEALPELYTSDNLELLKNYFYIHTLVEAGKLLDRQTCAMAVQCFGNPETGEQYDISDYPEGAEQSGITESSENQKSFITTEYLEKYVPLPLDLMCVSARFTPKDKENLTQMVLALKEAYKELIREKDWMSEEAKQRTCEKLDNMGINVLYPETFEDYSGLDVSKAGNLIELTEQCRLHDLARQAGYINQRFDRTVWNLSELRTMENNSCYRPDTNSIFIQAGMYLPDFVYSENNSMAQNYGGCGTVLGHEISHAFDTNGSRYDKDGNEQVCWTEEDEKAYRARVDELGMWLGCFIPVPGMDTFDGSQIRDEAQADIASLRCVMRVAEKTPDFDYDQFFRTYAKRWLCVSSYKGARETVEMDEHPADNLRVNIPLSLCEKFRDFYGVQESDGMYRSDVDIQQYNIW